MVDKVRSPTNSEWYTPSPEPFRINRVLRKIFGDRENLGCFITRNSMIHTGYLVLSD
jgi:hypothetical protein